MDVLLANPAGLEALTGEQREWLEQAAQDAARSAALADTDARVVDQSCASGERFAEASNADLTALEAAFAPVYAELQRQPDTKAFLKRIQTLKRATALEAEVAIPPTARAKLRSKPLAARGRRPLT